MTVGANKHMVLDVNGALSASDMTLHTGGILLSGGSDLIDIIDLKVGDASDVTTEKISNWDNTYTSVSTNSGDWNTAYGWGDHSTQNYATSAYVDDQIALLPSDDWTTVQSAVTANSADWTTAYGWGDHGSQSYATSAYVDDQVANLVDSAPTTLDTLNELAAALGDDANFSTTITNSIGTKWTQDDDKISNWDSTYTSVSTNSATWDTAYGWGDHGSQSYATSAYVDDQIALLPSDDWTTVQSVVTANSATWDTAYGWGDHSTQNYATSAYVDDQIALLPSDDWTTVQSAVTANSADWTTAYGWGDHGSQSYATSAYVDDQVANLVDSAPTTLDTLNELAAALGDDANFSTTVTNSIGTKWTQDNDKISNWDNTYTSVSTNSATWDTAYGWGDHSTQNYATSAYVDDQIALLPSDDWTTVQSVVTANSATWASHTDVTDLTSTVSTNSADWETAHGWGDHSTQNYATSAYVDDQIAAVPGETTTTLSLSSESDTLIYTDEDGSETQISLAAYTGEGISSIADATDTTFTSLSGGDVLVYVNGGTQKWQNKKDRASLEDMYNYANANFYSEMTYSTTDQLTGVYVWVSDTKSTALFERDLTYNANGQLTSVITRDVQGTGGSARATLTKNLAYTATGALSSTTRSYS